MTTTRINESSVLIFVAEHKTYNGHWAHFLHLRTRNGAFFNGIKLALQSSLFQPDSTVGYYPPTNEQPFKVG